MQRTSNGYELSIYSGELTAQCLLDEIVKLKKAFPALPIDFYDVLTDRIKESGFCDSRLIASINNAIDTCKYPTPTVATFLSYDKTIKLFNYEQMCELANKWGKGIWQKYSKTKINRTVYWHENKDIA